MVYGETSGRFGRSISNVVIDRINNKGDGSIKDVPVILKAHPDCAKATDIISLDKKISDLTWSIAEAQRSWNVTMVSKFLAYEKRINLLQLNLNMDPQQMLEKVCRTLTRWTKNKFYLNLTNSIKIHANHKTSQEYIWGTIKEFCNCV
ncbi:unnamed protein product [Bursaphelenchus xylophilus]|uniref:(pine wood nematode) hypothetical protein n=1 Tax=Bursaphelenchus xylophilus TaxID=6326 RepID=A0A1I7S4H8_BURXY|nr:unnamed protein product [Bursaphelenchus xylophilus]CAG9117110.1 unnamed protein product [Bursaphelenchus xylophilus]